MQNLTFELILFAFPGQQQWMTPALLCNSLGNCIWCTQVSITQAAASMPASSPSLSLEAAGTPGTQASLPQPGCSQPSKKKWYRSHACCCYAYCCCTWAAQYNTWLCIKLTPKGIVFSFLFLLLLLAVLMDVCA